MEFGLALVIFFSHAGENYSVGNIEVGNTKIVADYISELTGADQFEIVAVKDYDMPYNDLIKVAKEEANNGELPAYKGDIDVSKYLILKTVMWWLASSLATPSSVSTALNTCFSVMVSLVLLKNSPTIT